MGIPARHSNAPYVDGETLSGADLETDIANAYTEIGNIEATNLASNAVTTAKINASAVTTAKINDGAVTTAKIDANARENIEFATISGTVTISGTDHSIATDTITTKATSAGVVRIDCTIIFEWGSSVDADITVRLDRGTTAIETWTVEKPDKSTATAQKVPFTVVFCDSGATAATATTYTIECDKSGTGNPQVTQDRTIVLQEFRNE